MAESATIAKAKRRAANRATAVRVVTESDAKAVLDEGCYYDAKAAKRVVDFFADFLRHGTGEWAGQPFVLLPWQRKRVIEPLFGWKRRDHTRRFRRGGIWVPKKNGKTTLASGICLYLLMGDKEPGAKVCSAANDRSQAAFVYGECAAMVRKSPQLASILNPVDSRKFIAYIDNNGYYQALSADVPTKEGLNLNGLVADELHSWANRSMWSALAYAGASRRQPLCPLSISTAGVYDPASIGWEQYSYARRVLDNELEDFSFFALISEARITDDWTDPAVWRRANPSYGVTVKPDSLQEECREAMESPAKQNDFLRYRLNVWVQQVTRAIDLRVWDEASRHEITPGGRAWYGGLDLGGSSDLSAWVMVSPCVEDIEAVDVLCRFWLPEDVLKSKHPNRLLYEQWARDGYITLTAGNVADERFIEAQIIEDAKRLRLVDGNIDRLFQGQRMTVELAEEGITLVPFGQGFLSMAVPTRKFVDLVTSRRLHHGGHPILRWMANNVVLKRDAAGNMKVDKEKSPQKVDGIVACIMAIDRLERHAAAPPPPKFQAFVFGGR